jgi:methyl-accepting chemotaxis protein
METTNYNLENYKNIIFSGYEYKLPDNIITLINNLSNELGVTFKESIIKPENFQPEHTRKYSNKRSNFGINKRPKTALDEEQWEKMKAFKSTLIEKKEGIEKLINDVRVCLNKISNKNYESHRDVIIQYIKEIMDKKKSGEIEDITDIQENSIDMEISKITKAIFEIASSNKFYSELYAVLYKDLINSFNCFQDNIEPFINEYMENIQKIHYVDPKVDYDKYCDFNKENDKRKAMSAFIVNLSKNEIINKKIVIDTIIHLEDLVLNYCDMDEKTNEIEEITENLFILITKSLSEMKDQENWKIVFDNIKKLSQLKTKEHKGLSSRALFKFMDILDFIKKQNL